MNKLDYQKANSKCENALIDLPTHDDTSVWLEENKALFNSINIQPTGRPGIANSNFEGVRYEHISKFHSKYCIIENGSK